MTAFTAATHLPLSALTTLARLKERYACGPCLGLDASQRALLDAFRALYPRDKLRIVQGAMDAGRLCISGAEVLPLVPKNALTEEASAAFAVA
jgi:hypothetical protein